MPITPEPGGCSACQSSCSNCDGLILSSPNGTLYRIVVANDGTLSTEVV